MNVKEKLKARDRQTLIRIERAEKAAAVLRVFFEGGFKTFDALNAIVMNYYPELSEKRLWDFWHFRVFDEDMCEALNDVFEKLKAE